MNSESSGPGDKSRFIDIFYFMMLVEFRCFTCTFFPSPSLPLLFWLVYVAVVAAWVFVFNLVLNSFLSKWDFYIR